MFFRRLHLLTASSFAIALLALTAGSSQARFSWQQNDQSNKTEVASTRREKREKRKKQKQEKKERDREKKSSESKAPVEPSDGESTSKPSQSSNHTHPLGGDEAAGSNTAPLVVPPSTLDITTARFGKLEIDLKDAAFLEARVSRMHLVAERLDMAKGKLSSLGIKVDEGEFQEFTLDSLELSSQADLNFDINALLNNKTLQFAEPALAQARVVISQKSLNRFLNSEAVLERLSGTAKKRVPILSSLARQDVHFGFTFTGGEVIIQPDNHVHLTMHSKLGIGRAGVPVQLKAETKLALENGWVNLSDTKLLTGGQTVPRDMADKIVRRINDLSKWGTASDDIQFQFTSLQVIPGDRLELAGTATIKSVHFQRTDDSSTTDTVNKDSAPVPSECKDHKDSAPAPEESESQNSPKVPGQPGQDSGAPQLEQPSGPAGTQTPPTGQPAGSTSAQPSPAKP